MVPGVTVDREGRMPHTQARVAPSFDVAGWAAEAENEEITQPLFRSGQIVFRIEPAQNVVTRNLPVERRYKPFESFFTDRIEYFLIVHNADLNMTRISETACCSLKRESSHIRI